MKADVWNNVMFPMEFLRQLCWGHSISEKTWKGSPVVSKDAHRRTLQYHITSSWHLGGNIIKVKVWFFALFLLLFLKYLLLVAVTAIELNGLWHGSHVHLSQCGNIWSFLFVVYDQSYWFSMILRYMPFHLGVLHEDIPVLPYGPLPCLRYHFLLLFIAEAVFSFFQ